MINDVETRRTQMIREAVKIKEKKVKYLLGLSPPASFQPGTNAFAIRSRDEHQTFRDHYSPKFRERLS
jgi:hypothetical protein